MTAALMPYHVQDFVRDTLKNRLGINPSDFALKFAQDCVWRTLHGANVPLGLSDVMHQLATLARLQYSEWQKEFVVEFWVVDDPEPSRESIEGFDPLIALRRWRDAHVAKGVELCHSRLITTWEP